LDFGGKDKSNFPAWQHKGRAVKKEEREGGKTGKLWTKSDPGNGGTEKTTKVNPKT